jgi:hypothetical protein
MLLKNYITNATYEKEFQINIHVPIVMKINNLTRHANMKKKNLKLKLCINYTVVI